MPGSPRRRSLIRTAMALVVALATGAGVLALLPAAPAAASAATGAAIPTVPADAVTLHVDAVRGLATTPDGTSSRPFPTVTWAVAYGQHLRRQGRAVRIEVAPGTYRESVEVGAAGDNPPLVIESSVPGGAVVSGADQETRWSPIAGTAQFESPWAHNWGLTPVPGGWSGVTVPDGIRRREAVSIDGAPLTQVLDRSALKPGTFHVDEAGDRLIVHPPAGVSDLRHHLVEVAQRARALHIKGYARAVTVKGFVFESAATPLERHMAYVSDSSEILLEGNTFRHSSWGGLGICCTSGVTVRGNRAVDNGGNGIDTHRTTNALIESNHLSGNNVRGAAHGYVGWSVAASKNLLLHRATFRNNTYVSNHARGLWFDTDVRDVLVSNERSCRNLRDGIFIEAVQGPLTVEDTTLCDNGGAGILVGTSANVVVQRSTLTNNRYGQLVFSGDRQRSWIDRATGGLLTVGDFAGWSLIGNTFTSAGTAPLVYSPVIPIDTWRALLGGGELRARGNAWKRPDLGGAIRIQATNYPLDEWMTATGEGAAGSAPPGSGAGEGPGADSGAPPDRGAPSGTGPASFSDVLGNVHGPMIDALRAQGITGGCSGDGRQYCPERPVQRGQMASFLARALDLPSPTADHFPDDDGSVHEDAINRVADAGITTGRAGRFAPDEAVTREQMASFLARGLDLAPRPTSYLDVSSAHAAAVGAIEAAGITKGCTADGTRFCGSGGVRRDQMASFLGRALGLE